MPRLRDYFEDVFDGNIQAGPSIIPSSSAPTSPTTTVFSHDAFPYGHYSVSSAPSSPRQEPYAPAGSLRSGIYNDPRGKSYVRYSIDPANIDSGTAGGEPSLNQLADRHVRGQVVRKPLKPLKGGANQKGKMATPEAGLEDGSAGIGAVLLSMGRGPEGSGKAVVVGNDILRVVQFTAPNDLKPLPSPPHWVPLTFSTSNYAPPLPSSLTARAPTTPPLPAPYGRNGSNNRRRPAPALSKPASRIPSDAGQEEGTVIGEGPGGIALREIATLRGLREATGGSGVVEARWGWGGQASRVFVSGRKGNVMVWDVHSPGRMHTDIRVDPTRRPISVMRFGSAKDSSPTAASMVTGGHDSILRLYDFRMPSATPALTYSLSPALTSPITALAVSPTSALHVVLGLENGTIGWVDWRRTGRLVNRKFSAHGEGGVMTLDWKDGGRGGGDGWIASGGLDRKIHVWNMDDSSRPLHRTLRCAQPVAEVLWRPGHETELAVVPYVALSGSNANDEAKEVSAIQIWDVRRGYLPKHVLEGGDGAACGVAWNDHGALWAAYKTGTIIQHDVRHSSIPILDLPSTSSTWTPDGLLTFTAHRQLEGEAPFDDILPSAASQLESPPALKSMEDAVYDPDQIAVEVLVDGDGAGKVALLANRYRFSDRHPMALCQKNAQIAADVYAWQDHQVWRTLEGLLGIWQDLADAEAAQLPPSGPSALHDIPDLHLPPPRDSSPLRDRSDMTASARVEHNDASGQRRLSRSPLVNAVRDDDGLLPRPVGAAVLQSSNGKAADYADTFGVRLHLAVDDSDLEEAVTLSSESEDIESSSSSSSEDQLQTIPIPRQSRSKRSSFSSRRPSSSSQTRPGYSSPLAAHHGISASLPARQSSPHPNPRSYLRQFQGQNRLSPVQTPQANGPDSDSDDGTPNANSPQLSDDAYGVDPYGTGYGQASFMSTISSKTVTTKAAAAEASAASRIPTRAPLTAKSSPKVAATTTAAIAGRRPSFPTAQPLATQIRSQRLTDTASPAVSALRRSLQQVEQMSINDFELSCRRTLGAIITDYLDQGNCQMPSLIFILVKDLFPLSRARAARYVTAYYSLLTKLRLYGSAAKLRKYSGLPSVQAAVRKNTTTYLACPRHPAHALPYEELPASPKSNSWCLEEAKPAIICCLCSRAVFGVLSGCQACGHGGHWLCMEQWWKTAAEPMPASDEQEMVQRADTPPPVASSSGNVNGYGSDSSPTFPVRSPLATFSTRSETTGDGAIGSDIETVVWGWQCPTGCGCRCAVSHVGPPPSLQPTPLLLPASSRRSSLT